MRVRVLGACIQGPMSFYLFHLSISISISISSSISLSISISFSISISISLSITAVGVGIRVLGEGRELKRALGRCQAISLNVACSLAR